MAARKHSKWKKQYQPKKEKRKVAKKRKTPRKRKPVLSTRHRQVLDFYYGISNLNKTDALRRAGYAHPDKQHGLFSHPAVLEEMARREERFRQKYDVTYDRVRDEIAKVAFFNPMSILRFDEETGEVEVDLSRADVHEMAAIGEIRVKETTTNVGTKEDPEWETVTRVFVKPWNKMQALEQLMKHAGLSKEKDPLAGAIHSLGDRIVAARKRVASKEPK